MLPVIVGLWALFQPLAYPFLFPGFLLFLVPAPDWSMSERAVHTVFSSLAFWTASLWPLSLLGLPLLWYCHAVTALSLAVWAWLALRHGARARLGFRPGDVVILVVLALVVWLRLRPLDVMIAPAGADMSMHAYITRLIVDAGGVPASYLPLVALDRFPAFPIGFHTLAAMQSLLDGMPAWRAAFVMACLSHALFSAGIFVLVRRMVGWREGVVAAVAVPFLLRAPQAMAAWGGNSTVLALAFVPMLAVAEGMIRSGGNRLLSGGLCLLYLLALCMIHSIVFVQTCYIALLVLPAVLLAGPTPDRGYWKTLAVVAGLFLLLCVPFMLRMDLGAIDDRVIDWIANWVRNANHAWQGSAADALWSVPIYVYSRLQITGPFLSVVVILALAGAARFWYTSRESLAWCAAFAVASWLLIVNCQYWLLPGSYLIYPERTAAMLSIPLAVLAASGLRLGARCLGWYRAVWTGALAAALVFGIFGGETIYIKPMAERTTVTATDQRAIEWIATHTPPDAVIETNYADAGLWVPAMAGRTSTNPHVNIAVLYQVDTLERGDYAFTGAKAVYGEQRLQAEELMKQPERYQPVFQAGQSVVFKRLD